MTTTLQQMIAEPGPLLELAQRGEEVVLTNGGKPVVRLTGVLTPKPKPSPESLKRWMDEAAAAAAAGATGKCGPTSDEIIAELREERTSPTDAELEARREWLEKVARHAEAASTGKTGGPTTEEIIDDLRSERC